MDGSYIMHWMYHWQEEQRAAIERKLEEKGRAEKEELRRERLELFNLRKERQAQIRRLTLKMNRIKEVRVWNIFLLYSIFNVCI